MNASSKILLVCGFCISFGIYVSGIQEANWNIVDVGQQRSYYAEARMLSNAGLNHAIFNMRMPYWFENAKNPVTGIYSSSKIPFGDDTVWYTIDKNGLPFEQACVTVTAKYNGVYSRLRVLIKKTPDPTDINLIAASQSDGNGNLYSTWRVKQAYFYPYLLTPTEGSL